MKVRSVKRRCSLMLSALLVLLMLTACGGGGSGGLFDLDSNFDLDEVVFLIFDDAGFGNVEVLDAFSIDDKDMPLPNETGNNPVDVVVHPILELLYIANRGEDTVSVYDAFTLDFMFEIFTGAGSEPSALALNFDSEWLYVILQGYDTIAMYDAQNGTFWREEDTAPFPTDVVWYDFTDTVYVSSAANDTITLFDDDDLDAFAFVDTDDDGGMEPRSLSLDGGRNELYVACSDSDNVLVYDATGLDLIRVLSTGDRPEHVLAVPALDRIFVSNAGDDTLSAFDSDSGLELAASPIDTEGSNPGAMTVHVGARLIYVLNTQSSSMAIFRTNDLDQYGPSPYFIGSNPMALVVPESN